MSIESCVICSVEFDPFIGERYMMNRRAEAGVVFACGDKCRAEYEGPREKPRPTPDMIIAIANYRCDACDQEIVLRMATDFRSEIYRTNASDAFRSGVGPPSEHKEELPKTQPAVRADYILGVYDSEQKVAVAPKRVGSEFLHGLVAMWCTDCNRVMRPYSPRPQD